MLFLCYNRIIKNLNKITLCAAIKQNDLNTSFVKGGKDETPKMDYADKIDKAVILIKDDQGKERTWEASNPSFLKALLGNLNLVFGKDDKSAQRFDTPLTENEKAFTYQITFYKTDKVIQTVHMSQTKDITVDKAQFTVKKTDKQALDNLKQHLLVVAK